MSEYDCTLCSDENQKYTFLDISSLFDVDYKIMLEICEKCKSNTSEVTLIDLLNDGLKSKILDIYLDYDQKRFIVVKANCSPLDVSDVC